MQTYSGFEFAILTHHVSYSSSLYLLHFVVSHMVLPLSLTASLHRNRKVYGLMKISYNANYWQHVIHTLNPKPIYGTIFPINWTPEFINQEVITSHYLNQMILSLKINSLTMIPDLADLVAVVCKRRTLLRRNKTMRVSHTIDYYFLCFPLN